MTVPKSHPRYISLKTRDLIVDGVKKGITSEHGLIAHGRGEAFDYLIGEKTNKFAVEAIEAAAALLLLAKRPVVSVNGNAAALVPKELVKLSKIIPAKLEVNIFHSSKMRERKIKNHLIKKGAKEVLLPNTEYLKKIDHNRRFANKDGIANSDVVFVPLEDGDRCEALRNNGKKVITVDLNPLSRTAKSANVTIIDNISRAISLLIKKINHYKKYNGRILKNKIKKYDNKKILNDALERIKMSEFS
ncbi:phosphopantothenate/pantothenate synthetase [Candidatus Woesearchaeota archaeon]|nr:phosphopantothenate/pantothenate synthetase [Candidatus Woesearchaeota archaeon]